MRLEPVLFTVVNDPRLMRAISRRCAIARRRRRAALLIGDVRYAFQPRVVFRGAVRLSRPSLRMVSSRAKRRNGSIPRPQCGIRLDARMASGISRDAKLYVYSRRSTVPHFFVPPGDAAIAACQSVPPCP